MRMSSNGARERGQQSVAVLAEGEGCAEEPGNFRIAFDCHAVFGDKMSEFSFPDMSE